MARIKTCVKYTVNCRYTNTHKTSLTVTSKVIFKLQGNEQDTE